MTNVLQNIKRNINKDTDDLNLIDLAKQGNTTAFEKLVKKYEEKIYSLAYRILQDKEEAYDVLQDTAISAYKNLKNFRNQSSFSTWLYKIALNFALMKKRKQKSQLKKVQIVDADDTDKLPQLADISEQNVSGNYVDWSSNPAIDVENQELREILNKALDKLPEKYKSVIILKDIEDRSVEEVSKILGLSIPAVKTRLHRGRLYLKWLLEKYLVRGQLI